MYALKMSFIYFSFITRVWAEDQLLSLLKIPKELNIKQMKSEIKFDIKYNAK